MGRKRDTGWGNLPSEEEDRNLDAGPTRTEPDASDEVAVEIDDSAAFDAEPEDAASMLDVQQQLADWKERAMRTAAEMENFRRRSQIEAQNIKKFANEGLVYDLLPVLDNFQRAVDAAEKTPNFEALKSGVDLIFRQLNEVLAKVGLEHIEAIGQPFDPNYHQAVMQVEPEDHQEPHQVVEELRPGYTLNDRVLRPSLVKVTSG
jgi:molecular chaperone GrpE